MALHDLPTDEALALLQKPKVCEDPVDWRPGDASKQHQQVLELEQGLLDANGRKIGVLLKLSVRLSLRTGITRHVFTLFQMSGRGLGRAYQLDCQDFLDLPQDRHQWPHEHVGKDRIIGEDHWRTWSFEDCIVHFCNRTNTTFSPPVPPPLELRLKG